MNPDVKAMLDKRIAEIVFPDWKYLPSDEVVVHSWWEDAGGYSEYTQWDACMELNFTIKRKGYNLNSTTRHADLCASANFYNEEAGGIWVKIMLG